jgi:hypothetical protein
MPSIAILAVVETYDARLQDPEGRTKDELRTAAWQALRSNPRIVAIMPENEARLMMHAHDLASRAAGHPGAEIGDILQELLPGAPFQPVGGKKG